MCFSLTPEACFWAQSQSRYMGTVTLYTYSQKSKISVFEQLCIHTFLRVSPTEHSETSFWIGKHSICQKTHFCAWGEKGIPHLSFTLQIWLIPVFNEGIFSKWKSNTLQEKLYALFPATCSPTYTFLRAYPENRKQWCLLQSRHA